MDKQNLPRRWAKVLVVDGVMACIQHVWDGDNEGYAITCTIQSTQAKHTTSIGRDEPFSQDEFDQIGDDLVRQVIANARRFGFEPMTVAEATHA